MAEAQMDETSSPTAPKKKRGRSKGSVGKKRGPGRPKGSGRKAGRPAKKSRRGRPRGTTKTRGFLAGAIAKQLKSVTKQQKADLTAQMKKLVAKEVQKALKAAFR